MTTASAMTFAGHYACAQYNWRQPDAGVARTLVCQTNLLVMHAGTYRFLDVVHVGMPFTLFMWAGYLYVIPKFFSF